MLKLSVDKHHNYHHHPYFINIQSNFMTDFDSGNLEKPTEWLWNAHQKNVAKTNHKEYGNRTLLT